jgi:hypothetical protein
LVESQDSGFVFLFQPTGTESARDLFFFRCLLLFDGVLQRMLDFVGLMGSRVIKIILLNLN